jgi:hypothetical protein
MHFHVTPCFSHSKSTGASSEKTDSDTHAGRPARKSSQAVKALIDRVSQIECSEQSDDAIRHADFADTDLDFGSHSSENEASVGGAIQQPVAKKKFEASIVDVDGISDDEDDDGKVPMSFSHNNLLFECFHVQNLSPSC